MFETTANKQMLITFSGMVGSGKSTNAKKVLQLLRDESLVPYYLRFRFVTWRDVVRAPQTTPWQPRTSYSGTRRAQGLPAQSGQRHLARVRTLTIGRFLIYFIRALKLRLVLHRHFDKRLVVMNRYFYDNLAHYRLATSTEKRLARLLTTVMPQPDLALVMLVSPETAQQRRPAYDTRELERLCAGYDRLLRYLPGLTAISTDDLNTLDERVADVVAAWLGAKNAAAVT